MPVKFFDFNSRPSARGDDNTEVICVGRVFQFTPLREGRRCRHRRRIAAANFNSRPSARGDQMHRVCKNPPIFQFTPLREGRHGFDTHIQRVGISIHAPPRGATGGGVLLVSLEMISIHAPPRGATWNPNNLNMRCIFQFTPLREGRRFWRSARNAANLHFNSRPSARGDTIL